MILPDINVLLFALRPETVHHARCYEWLDSVINGDDPFGISPQVLSSVTRIATHPRIFPNPSSHEEVFEFANRLIAQQTCQIIQSGPRHWRIFCDLCRRATARGDLVADAWFAALAIESGCEWVTLDRDYARFEGLRWRTPF